MDTYGPAVGSFSQKKQVVGDAAAFTHASAVGLAWYQIAVCVCFGVAQQSRADELAARRPVSYSPLVVVRVGVPATA